MWHSVSHCGELDDMVFAVLELRYVWVSIIQRNNSNACKAAPPRALSLSEDIPLSTIVS